MLYDIEKIDTSATLLAATIKEIHRHVFSLEDSLSSAKHEAESYKMDVKKARDEVSMMSLKFEQERRKVTERDLNIAALDAEVKAKAEFADRMVKQRDAELESRRAAYTDLSNVRTEARLLTTKFKKLLKTNGIQYRHLLKRKPR
jgi:chromosome segregation ATPase